MHAPRRRRLDRRSSRPNRTGGLGDLDFGELPRARRTVVIEDHSVNPRRFLAGRAFELSLRPTEMQPSASEIMIAAAAREIRDRELVFVGMRLPLLAFMLAKKTHAPSAVGLYENGVIRTDAATELLYTMSDPPNVTGATRTGDMLEVMGLLQSGRVGLGFVGAAEVDRFGNLNTTRVAGTRLPGSGGASDIASLSHRLVVVLGHEKNRLVPKVHYVTSPGWGDGGGWRTRVGLIRGGPSAVITDRAVLRFNDKTREAELVSYHSVGSPDDVVSVTGWPLTVRDDVAPTPLPSESELAILRSIDPDRVWLGAR